MAFITNEKGGRNKLGDRLSALVKYAERLDMLVGYFFFSGVKVMYDALKARPDLKVRVLVGMDAEIAMGHLVEDLREDGNQSVAAIKARFYESMKKIVGAVEVDKQAFHDRLDLFVELLRNHRLELRKTVEPNHAKLYIFTIDAQYKELLGKEFITGSSNFSAPGLEARNEFNVEIRDFGIDEAQRYFDDLWERAVPLTATEEDVGRVVKILQECSVAAAVSPFEAYYLVMKTFLEYQQAVLNTERLDRLLANAGFSKYRYQVDAVAQALRKLDEYQGVVIADVVGLGKSVIASLVGALRRRRGLVICPPGLMGNPQGESGGWYEYKRKFGLHDWEVWSCGKLEEIEELLKHDPDFDMVVVDEAHNFRNEETRDYGRLANICFGREVVLLTATPFNNRPSDLLSLLKLFVPAKAGKLGEIEDQFRYYQIRYKALGTLSRALSAEPPDWGLIHSLLPKCGIEVLTSKGGRDLMACKVACQKRLRKIAEGVRQVMEKVTIRRNRLDLLNDPDYKGEIENLSTVMPPQKQFFELTVEQDAFYDRVITKYFAEEGEFHGAIYHPQDYYRDKSGKDDSQFNIYKMLRSQLVQRFESSFGSFRKSVENVLHSMKISRLFIEKTGLYLYARQLMERLLFEDDEAKVFREINEYLKTQIEKAKLSGAKAKKTRAEFYRYNMDDPNFNADDFKAHLESDIALMERILSEVDRLHLIEDDPKAEELCRAIHRVLEGSETEMAQTKRKVIVFSAFTDTIDHIRAYVERAFPDRVMTVTGANFSATLAKKCKANFDASFEPQQDDYDILLASDKLSEGFNLNRAGVVVNYDIPWNPTRVIQRVGRINRIGKKVFENLYIFNFFPTVVGSSLVQNDKVAMSKMMAIHNILGEDAQIFSLDETPTPSKLYDKLCSLDDGETVSFHTKVKVEFRKATAFLEKHHPEVIEKVDDLPSMVKTAWECGKTQPHATFMFKRSGSSFSVIARTEADGQVTEWGLKDALEQIACTYDTPREEFRPEFWQFTNWKNGDPSPRGVYEELKLYKPKGIPVHGGVPEAVEAVLAIERYRQQLSFQLKRFAGEVAEDIQSFGTIPLRTIKQLALANRMKDGGKALGELVEVLENLLELRGLHYLDAIREQVRASQIVVTIEKH